MKPQPGKIGFISIYTHQIDMKALASYKQAYFGHFHICEKYYKILFENFIKLLIF